MHEELDPYLTQITGLNIDVYGLPERSFSNDLEAKILWSIATIDKPYGASIDVKIHQVDVKWAQVDSETEASAPQAITFKAGTYNGWGVKAGATTHFLGDPSPTFPLVIQPREIEVQLREKMIIVYF